MRLNFLKIGILAFALVSAFACKEKEVVPPVPPASAGSIKLSSGVYNAPGYYSVKKIKMVANRAWVANIPADAKDWVEVIPASGEASKEEQFILIKVLANKLTAERRVAEIDFQLAVPEEGAEAGPIMKVNQVSDFYFEKDSLVLLQLYADLDGANWTNPWDLSKPVSKWGNYVTYTDGSQSWDGVWLSKTGDGAPRRVSSIWYVAANNIKGQLKGETMGQFTALGGIMISKAPDLTCDLDELAKGLKKGAPGFEMLRLVDCPSVTGLLPASFNGFQNLISFEFSRCGLTGIEEGFGADLPVFVGLTMPGNKLSGPILASWFSRTTKLALIDVSDNNLEGSVPADILATMPNLLYFGISGNRLTGDFPEAIKHHPCYTAGDPNEDMCPQQPGFGFTIGTCEKSAVAESAGMKGAAL